MIATNQTSFSPTINLNGRTYAPAGWQWVLAYALHGVPWAVIEAEKPEFKELVKRDTAMRAHLQFEPDYSI